MLKVAWTGPAKNLTTDYQVLILPKNAPDYELTNCVFQGSSNTCNIQMSPLKESPFELKYGSIIHTYVQMTLGAEIRSSDMAEIIWS